MKIGVGVHILIDTFRKIVRSQINGCGNFTFYDQTALPQYVGVNLFRALGVQVQFFELIDGKAGDVVANGDLVAHVLDRHADGKRPRLAYDLVAEFGAAHRQKKNVLIPKRPQATPVRRHDVGALDAAGDEYAARTQGGH